MISSLPDSTSHSSQPSTFQSPICKRNGTHLSSSLILALVVGGILSSGSLSLAADKTYQVTGPVLAMDATTITVEKGKEKWTILKDTIAPNSSLKVGDKVTITYKMVATSVEVKPATKK